MDSSIMNSDMAHKSEYKKYFYFLFSRKIFYCFLQRVCDCSKEPCTDRNFVDNFLQVEIYLALVANI